MAGSFSLSSEVRVFPCPNCGETINTFMTECQFCHIPIDHASAEQAAVATSRISQACSDASCLRIMLGAYLTFIVLLIFPFLGLVGIVGFVFLKYATPIMVARWWVKYARIKTTHLDFSKARKTTILVSVVSLLVLLLLRVTFFGLRL